MPKYGPENRRNLERKVKELNSKAKDRTKHMSNVVKNDAKAIADLSKKIRPGGTIEGGNVTKEAYQQAGGEVKKEYGRQKKSLEDIMKKGGKTERELEERGKYSKLNYAELTKASSSIKETHAAKRGLDQGRQVAQENIQTMDSLRDSVHRVMQRTSQCFQKMNYEIANTLISANSGVNPKYWMKAHQVNQIGATKESSRKKCREANKDKVAEYKKKWNESNREEIRLLGLLNKERFDESGERKRKDNEANREEIRLSKLLKKERLKKSSLTWKYHRELKKRKYREANREKIAKGVKMFHEANREKIAAIQKKHREANKEKGERGKNIALPVFGGDGKHQINIDNEIAEEVKKILPEIENEVLQDCIENPGKFLTDDAEYLEVIKEISPEMPNEVLQDCIEYLRESSDDEISMERCKSEAYGWVCERNSSEERNEHYKS